MNRVATIIRLRPDTMARVKRKAKQEGRSLNAYVEHILERQTEVVFPEIKNGDISREILNLGGCIAAPTRETLDNDPKLAYLWDKYGTL